jgi:hypothetical protein
MAPNIAPAESRSVVGEPTQSTGEIGQDGQQASRRLPARISGGTPVAFGVEISEREMLPSASPRPSDFDVVPTN